jgi:hypothetical protein
MIRIDEIYNNTFKSWVDHNLPLTRLFYCDPFGCTSPENLYNFGDSECELNYIFLHDQEPIHLDIHKPLFDKVVQRNLDLNYGKDSYLKQSIKQQALVCSEFNSEAVKEVEDRYQWKAYHYFFHGWAALDWYRGYDRTFLMSDPGNRTMEYSVFSPNRIIGGRRDHRVLLMYWIAKYNIQNHNISCPSVCPVEQSSIQEIAQRYQAQYPDIVEHIDQLKLPWCYPGEDDHPMHSCWLSLFDQAERSLVYLVTETLFFGQRNHLTEKTFKPICLRMPFIIASNAGSLAYLRRYGFKTFSSVWDESYDNETNDLARVEKIAQLVKHLDSMSQIELQQLHDATKHIVEYNYNHFYNGDFEKILWQELTTMLGDIRNDFNI